MDKTFITNIIIHYMKTERETLVKVMSEVMVER